MMRTVRVRRALLQGWPRAAVSFGRAVSQSAQLLLYPSNPFRLAGRPGLDRRQGWRATKNATASSFTVSAANQRAGAYTLQFFNASKSFGTSNGTLTFSNGITACGASPVTGNNTIN
jgi:hypothetical protein